MDLGRKDISDWAMFFPPMKKPKGKGTLEFTIKIDEPRVTKINSLVEEDSVQCFNVISIVVLEGMTSEGGLATGQLGISNGWQKKQTESTSQSIPIIPVVQNPPDFHEPSQKRMRPGWLTWEVFLRDSNLKSIIAFSNSRSRSRVEEEAAKECLAGLCLWD
ncbi:unnamed protein product [Prunus armeniaca]